MAAEGVNSLEDVDMSDRNGEKVVTMMDVLQEQEEFEEDANAVLGASDHKDCTYSKGYIKRQAVYACLTCCSGAKEDASQRAGVCLACSLNCHENHDLIELYTKRNFRCDCGNPKFTSHPCHFIPNKTELNAENKYNQNFSGIYCVCNRPYPDPDMTTDDEMIQCIICEDWLHSSHLESVVPSHDQYSEMVCKSCMDKNDFLHDYADIAINVENESVDFVNDSTINVTGLNDTSICDISVATDSENNKTTLNDITQENENSEIVEKCDRTREDVENENSKENSRIVEKSDGSLEEKKNENSNENAGIVEKCDRVLEYKETENSNENSGIVEKCDRTLECKENENCNDNSEIVEKCDSTLEYKEKIDTMTDIGTGITENNTQNIEAIETSNKETSDEAGPVVGGNEHNNLAFKASEVSEEISTVAPNTAEPIEQEDEKNTITSNADNGLEVDSDHKEIDAIDKFLAGDDETHITQIKSTDIVANDTKTNESETDEKGEIEASEKNTCKETKTEMISSEQHTPETEMQTTIESTSNDEAGETPNTEISPDTENTSSTSENNETGKLINDSTETNDNSSTLENESPEKSNNQPITTESLIHNDIQMNEDVESEKQTNNDNKRKLSIEDDNETSICKRPRTNSNCTRPTSKKVMNGATFWPSTFRQKLCTCNECITMYKDLSVLFLTDLEDTVSAYEALGKEKTNGVAGNQYEQGLEALSSLDRVQQINALTEYNKMRDKLLDFLKSFKERKEVVKEEDIKEFFAGMKAKREPDGVYFCR